jgi:hypothetical protein
MAYLLISHRTFGSLALAVVVALARLRLPVKKMGSCKRIKEAMCDVVIRVVVSSWMGDAMFVVLAAINTSITCELSCHVM